MLQDAWNAETFESDLTATLVTTLAGGGEASLTAALNACAAAGETSCIGRQMACTAGCPHCCVLNVAVLLPEALVIADWISEHLSPSELNSVLKRLALHRAWNRWMDDDERIAKHITCPMLSDAGDCNIHPVRPIQCHGGSSLDRDSCREAMSPGITDEVRLVPTDLLRRAAFDAAFSALARALKLQGLDDRSIDVGVGVIGFSEHPEYREILLSGGKLPDELWR